MLGAKVAFSLLFLTALLAQPRPVEEGTAVLGLDHVIVAVNDLDKAAQQYRDLGFALKPGRPHDNGIRNQHVKFPDGTELAGTAGDSLRIGR